MKSAPSVSAVFVTIAGLLLGGTSFLAEAQAAEKHAKRCSNATLHGSFGFYRTGNTPLGPLAALGIITYDGNQNFSGSQSISRNGAYDFDLEILGTYLIAEDCTGKGFTVDGDEFFRIVITAGGRGFYILSESNGNAIYGVGRRIEDSDDD